MLNNDEVYRILCCARRQTLAGREREITLYSYSTEFLMYCVNLYMHKGRCVPVGGMF